MPELKRLPTLQGQAAGATPDAVAALADEFSTIIENVRIGAFFKCTRSKRLVVADRALLDHIDRSIDTVDILDVGGSDGVTTLDLAQAVRDELDRPVRAVVIDRYLHLQILQRGWLQEYRSGDGAPVLARLGRVGLPLGRADKGGWLNTLRNPLAAVYLRLGRWRAGMVERGRLTMTSPALAASDLVEAIELDCRVAQPEFFGRFHVVRVSNVLNPNTFSEAERRRVYTLCHGYLRPNGLLLVSRNHVEDGGEIERGTLWRRTEHGFEPRERFGGGSELEAEVTAFRP